MRRFGLLGCAAAALLVFSATARAGLIDIGSSLTFDFSDAPDTYTFDTTFSSTPVFADNGAVQLWQQQTPTAGGGEWDIFYMSIVDGGPLANDLGGDWSITMDYTLTQPSNFDGVVSQWAVNGTPVSPLNNQSWICCASASNPAIPGEAFYSSGFTDLLPAGTQTGWDEIYMDPYSSYATAVGVNPSTADDFTFALHFDPQTPSVPEPTTLALIGGGLLVLGLRRRGRA